MIRRRKEPQAKAAWTRAFPEQMQAAAPKLPKHRSKRSGERLRYKSRAAAFMLREKRRQWWCDVALELFGERLPISEVHHQRGRAGSLLLDERFWKAVSAKAHDYIHRRIKEAQKHGWIAGPGEWGKQEP